MYKAVMSMLIQDRYNFLNKLCKEQFGGNIYKMALYVGCTYNRVKEALNYVQHPPPFIAKSGPEPIIKRHHEIFIEIQTLINHNITNQQLADLLVETFPDIEHCSANTVSSARKKLGMKYAPPRSVVKLRDHSKSARVNWCQHSKWNNFS